MRLKVPNKVKRMAIKNFNHHIDESLLLENIRSEVQDKSSMTEDIEHRRHDKYVRYWSVKAEKISRYSQEEGTKNFVLYAVWRCPQKKRL